MALIVVKIFGEIIILFQQYKLWKAYGKKKMREVISAFSKEKLCYILREIFLADAENSFVIKVFVFLYYYYFVISLSNLMELEFPI